MINYTPGYALKPLILIRFGGFYYKDNEFTNGVNKTVGIIL